MIRTLLLYESKYGFTEKIAKNLAMILGPTKCLRPVEYHGNGSDYEVVVICTPIYSEKVDDRMLEYVSKNADWTKKKKVFLVCTCLAEDMAGSYLEPLCQLLGECVLSSTAIKGDIVLHNLEPSDLSRIQYFLKKTGLPLRDYRLFDENEFIKSSLKIKQGKDSVVKQADNQKLKESVDCFINGHNTCALATGHGNSVRVTPIEYFYDNNAFYLFSEGGEKFANLLLNSNVSLCIYDSFQGMSELGGMQITGHGEIIPFGSREYQSILDKKGLSLEKICSLPIILNLIKVNISKIEFLWSGFAKEGYDVKQILVR